MAPSPGIIARIRQRFSLAHDPVQAAEYKKRLRATKLEFARARHKN